METQVRTPQSVFILPQRLMVPLFQRRYVWNQEIQWEPLWDDLIRVADRLLDRPNEKPQPHFIGAVVLQQLARPIGQLQARTIIDGQQRLTTLQLLMDALHGELLSVDARPAAMRIDQLVANSEHFCSAPEDRFKVWPTNRDRAAFNAVMSAAPPVKYDALVNRGERLVEAHRFFADQARQWLSAKGPDAIRARGDAIDLVVRELLQMVVIDLGPDENAQEIFETLNTRGTPLTAADLIKNFVFQRLSESGANVEEAFQRNWAEFETGFWETEISVGRVRYSRSAIFLNHWLIARTGDDILAREVFSRFKRFASFDVGLPIPTLLQQIQTAAAVYRQFVTSASTLAGPIDRLGLFGYRTGVLESEVIRPLVLYLLDPEQPRIPPDQLEKGLDVVESWMVRRMLVRATTKNYNQIVSQLVRYLRMAPDRSRVGDLIEGWLADQKGASQYWPDDDEIRTELRELLAYRRLSRGRLRMVLEAIEDHLRGWTTGKSGYAAERVPRGTLAIEHVMPRKWTTHWPSAEGSGGEADRDRLIHTLGNLTLLTTRLNTKVSNGPWSGNDGKRDHLNRKDVLLLTRDLLENAGETWNDDAVRARTEKLMTLIVEIWPVPPGHRSGFSESKVVRGHRKVHLSDLIGAGLLEPGMTLFPRKAFAGRVATLLPDGRIDVDGTAFSKPSDAAAEIAGKRRNGMWFFLVTQEPKRSLSAVRREYVAKMSVDTEDDEADDDDDDDEA